MGESESNERARPTRREQCRRVWILFSLWRKLRPFWGGFLMAVGALLIAFLPLYFEQLLVFTASGFTSKGVFFAILVFLCGLSALTFPRFSSVLGGLGMVLSTLSLFGAFGGFIVGAFLAGLGGLLCFAWQPPENVDSLIREHVRRAGHDPDAFDFDRGTTRNDDG